MSDAKIVMLENGIRAVETDIPTTQEDIMALACHDPDCDCGGKDFYVDSLCHPQGGAVVKLSKDTPHLLGVHCRLCGREIAVFAIAKKEQDEHKPSDK